MSAEESDPAGRADLSNWRTSPYNRWAFQHVDTLIPCALIAAAPRSDPASVAPLPQALLDFDAFRISNGPAPVLDLPGFLHETATDGWVVLHEGKVVHEFYDNGLVATRPHIVMSVTKSVTGLLAGVLQGDGRLDVDRPVTDYVPEVAHTAYRGASVRQLLDMRTGVALDGNDAARYRLATHWDAPAPGEAFSDLHSFFRQLTSRERPHGGPFAYVSANTDLLGWVIERAAGQSFATLASERLWRPLGAAQDAFMTVDREGAPRCTGGFGATARDLARLGQLIVDDGHRGSTTIVPSAWIEDIATGGDPQAWKDGEFGPGFPGLPMHYRSGWYVIAARPRLLFTMGIHGQHLFVDREHRLVIAKLSSLNAPFDPRATGLTLRAVAAIRKLLPSA